MQSNLTRNPIRVFLVYVLIVCLAAAGAYAAGVVFRQYLRIANQLTITAGLLTVLLLWNREVRKDQKHGRKKAKIVTAAVILLVLMGLSLQLFIMIIGWRMILKIIRPMLIAMSIWQNSKAVLLRSKAARRKAFSLFAII